MQSRNAHGFWLMSTQARIARSKSALVKTVRFVVWVSVWRKHRTETFIKASAKYALAAIVHEKAL